MAFAIPILFFVLMIISMVIVGNGVFFSILGIVFMYTGRAMSYDRAGRQIAMANGEWDRAKEEAKAEKAAKKAAKKAARKQPRQKKANKAKKK